MSKSKVPPERCDSLEQVRNAAGNRIGFDHDHDSLKNGRREYQSRPHGRARTRRQAAAKWRTSSFTRRSPRHSSTIGWNTATDATSGQSPGVGTEGDRIEPRATADQAGACATWRSPTTRADSPRTRRRTAARETPGPRGRHRAAPRPAPGRSGGHRVRHRSTPRPPAARRRCVRSPVPRSHAEALADSRATRLRPAAIAWPPKRRIRPGSRMSSSAIRSRRCTPGTDRAEAFSSSLPVLAAANANTGRCTRSLIFDATRPTTPACQSVSCRHSTGGRSPSRRRPATAASACATMSSCTLRRSRIDRIEACGQFARQQRIVGAEAGDAETHVLQAPGSVDARPQTESRDPWRSARRRDAWRLSISAATPALARPARIRFRPAATSTRLL